MSFQLRPTDPDPANDVAPFHTYTLKDFNHECLHLYRPHEGENYNTDGYSKGEGRVIQFAISGRHPDHLTQAYIDVLQYAAPNSTEFTLIHDFISLLCISETLCHVHQTLSVHPIPPFKTMNCLHVTHPICPTGDVSESAYIK